MRFLRHPALPRCALLLGLLAGCSSVAHVEPPPSQASPPQAFSAPVARMPGDEQDVRAWWRVWNDPAMQALIDQALAANPDIRTAQANLEAARAVITAAESALYPTLSTNAVGATGRIDWQDQEPWRALLPPLTSHIPSSSQAKGYAAGVSAAWEADVFGGNRANEQAARAAAAIAEERLHGAHVLVAAEVAGNYRQALALRQRLAILDESIATTEELHRYVQARFMAGHVKAAEVAFVRARLEEQQAARPYLAALFETRLRRLAVLCGLPPQHAPALASEAMPVPPPPSGQLPSSVLDRRPDARAARWAVEARAAQLKRLKADLLPSFGIVFLGGDGHLEFAGIPAGMPGVSGFGGLLGLRISLPLFNAGRLNANVRAGDAQLQAAVADYDKAVLAALEDVENAYGMRFGLDARISGLERSRDASRRVAESKQVLFDAGEATRDEVLKTRIEVIRTEDALAQLRMEQAIVSVQLYQALGGGW
jgi:NodT family efflux transporter outer membrane factor (OMF) lipoprotein